MKRLFIMFTLVVMLFAFAAIGGKIVPNPWSWAAPEPNPWSWAAPEPNPWSWK